ncbi:MAG: arsenate reductase family protein [Cyanobacteria bacterium HKST-UBA04]|nr:arsenate reductase family protein [Cyanobacteria bacterium HKST-UBA04]
MAATKTKITIETMYWLPYCTTCQKAKAYLEAAGAKVAATVDVKTEPVSMATLKKLAKGVGGVEALFSKRAIKYRSLGLHEQTLSEQAMLDWMHQEYTFIKRPVIVTTDGRTLAGFSKKQYDALLSG